MVRFEENQGKEIPYDITDWVGIELEDNSRGIVLYIGDGYHIISSEIAYSYLGRNDSNIAYGGLEYTGKTVKDTIDKWKHTKYKAANIRYVYCFDTYKEMVTWFADGIKD